MAWLRWLILLESDIEGHRAEWQWRFRARLQHQAARFFTGFIEQEQCCPYPSIPSKENGNCCIGFWGCRWQGTFGSVVKSLRGWSDVAFQGACYRLMCCNNEHGHACRWEYATSAANIDSSKADFDVEKHHFCCNGS